jgi:DNA polymerase III epsilon subunit-like protein
MASPAKRVVSPQHAQFWANLPALHVVDVETTGLDAGDRIISVGFVKVLRGKTLDTWSSLVNPRGKFISRGAEEVHGLVDSDLTDAPTFDSLRDSIGRWLQPDVIFVGHNLGFDFSMLRREFEASGSPLTTLTGLDTMTLAAAAGIAAGRISLSELLERLGLANSAEHTAVGDALATAQAVIALLGLLVDQGRTSIDDLTFTTDSVLVRELSEQEVQELLPDTPEHHASHSQPMMLPEQRQEALDYCLSVGCTILQRRMQDALAGPEDARWVVAWAIKSLTEGIDASRAEDRLSREVAGRLLAGIGRAVPRARDSQYARDTYKKLMPAFAHNGACADTLVAGERCDCCQRGTSLCRLLRVRRNLAHAYIHVKYYDDSPARNAKRKKAEVSSAEDELTRAAKFLPITSPKEKGGRGGSRVGFFHELVKLGDLDAAGYGAAQVARIRRQRKGLEWSRKTLEVAWDRGCRNLMLTDELTALISIGAGAGRERTRTPEEALADLTLARAPTSC